MTTIIREVEEVSDDPIMLGMNYASSKGEDGEGKDEGRREEKQ
jgi:hypothetical protein